MQTTSLWVQRKTMVRVSSTVANDCPADLNLDGAVTTADLLVFLVDFGAQCE